MMKQDMDQKSIVSSWSAPNVVNHYATHRGEVNDLYKSEKKYLEAVVKGKASILDVGCAAGGFSKIVKIFNPVIRYTGIDISSAMIEEARKRSPKDTFESFDGNSFKFSDNEFEAVICFGVLHMVENWRELLKEAWRVCEGTLLFDIRATDEVAVYDPETSYQKLEFDGKWDGKAKAPYIVVNIGDLAEYLDFMRPPISNLKAYGYWHPVSHMTTSPFKEACMTIFCLEKTGGGEGKISEWDVPVRPTSGAIAVRLREL